MQIVPAQREFADQHAARRAIWAAAAYRPTAAPVVIPAVVKVAPPKIDPLTEALKRAIEAIPLPCPETAVEKITVRKIILYVAHANRLTYEDIIGQRRDKYLMKPRMTAIFCTWALLPLFSFPKIGLQFGGRDHTTILHTVRKMSAHYNLEYPQGRATAAIIARGILAEAGYDWSNEDDSPAPAAMCAERQG